MAAPSFPDVHVTGAVHHYVRRPGPNEIIHYLGTAEITPMVQEAAHGQDVMNDIAGKTLPFQRTDDGSDAIVAAMLNYFSKTAWAVVKTSGFRAGRHLSPGTESRWARGGLKFGVTTVEVWQVFENYFNPNTFGGASAGLEIGYYWPQCELWKADVPKMGTQAQSQLVVFQARPLFIPQASALAVNAANNERGKVLYSSDPSNFPADVRVPQ